MFKSRKGNKTNIFSRKHNGKTTLRITKKNFQDEELPHESLLTTRQKTKVINAFVKNTSTNIKRSNAQLSKIFQSGGFLGNTIGKLGNEALMKFAVPMAIDIHKNLQLEQLFL